MSRQHSVRPKSADAAGSWVAVLSWLTTVLRYYNERANSPRWIDLLEYVRAREHDKIKFIRRRGSPVYHRPEENPARNGKSRHRRATRNEATKGKAVRRFAYFSHGNFSSNIRRTHWTIDLTVSGEAEREQTRTSVKDYPGFGRLHLRKLQKKAALGSGGSSSMLEFRDLKLYEMETQTEG